MTDKMIIWVKSHFGGMSREYVIESESLVMEMSDHQDGWLKIDDELSGKFWIFPAGAIERVEGEWGPEPENKEPDDHELEAVDLPPADLDP